MRGERARSLYLKIVGYLLLLIWLNNDFDSIPINGFSYNQIC
jgi:hypothetical protein